MGSSFLFIPEQSRAEQKRSCTGYPQCCETVHFSAFQWFYFVLVHVFRSTIESIELLAHEPQVPCILQRFKGLWSLPALLPSNWSLVIWRRTRSFYAKFIRKNRTFGVFAKKPKQNELGPCNAPIPWICWDFFRRGTKLLRHLAHGLSCFLSSVADR